VTDDLHRPAAIVVDLDGTLALLGDRDPYDASTCERDQVNTVVREIIGHYDHVVICSGRDDRWRRETERWLTVHGIRYELLLMRRSKDFRKDAVVKREMYVQAIEPRFRVRFVLDDRNQVVEMWRSIGLTCLQVAPGDF
jgi:hypothetical protein